MFKNHAFQVKMVKDADASNDSPTITEALNEETVQLIESAGQRLMKNLGITVVAVVAAIKIIDTLSQIAIKKTKSADNEK